MADGIIMSGPADDPMAAIPDGLCPNTRAAYAVRVRDTNEARAKLQKAFDAFNAAKADVVACQRGEAKALAELVEERTASELLNSRPEPAPKPDQPT